MNTYNNENFCKQLSNKLKERKMTQKQLSELTGISDTTVAFYVSGKRSPNLHIAYKIANALECTVDELTGVKNSYYFDNKEVSAIVSMYLMINEKGKSQLYDYLDNLTSNPKNIDLTSENKLTEIKNMINSL